MYEPGITVSLGNFGFGSVKISLPQPVAHMGGPTLDRRVPSKLVILIAEGYAVGSDSGSASRARKLYAQHGTGRSHIMSHLRREGSTDIVDATEEDKLEDKYVNEIRSNSTRNCPFRWIGPCNNTSP